MLILSENKANEYLSYENSESGHYFYKSLILVYEFNSKVLQSYFSVYPSLSYF